MGQYISGHRVKSLRICVIRLKKIIYNLPLLLFQIPLSEKNTPQTNYRNEVIFAAAAFSTSGSCERQRRCSTVQQSWWRVQSVHKKVGNLYRKSIFSLTSLAFMDWKTICRAHATYAEAMLKGDDGRPDFEARKACNYLEDAIEVYIHLDMYVTSLMDNDSRWIGVKDGFLLKHIINVNVSSRTAPATWQTMIAIPKRRWTINVAKNRLL